MECFNKEYKCLERKFSINKALKFCRKWLFIIGFDESKIETIMTVAVSNAVPVYVLKQINDNKLMIILNLLLDLYEDGTVLESYTRMILSKARTKVDINYIRNGVYTKNI